MINSNNNTETETFNCSGGNHTHQRDQKIFLQLIFFAMNARTTYHKHCTANQTRGCHD